MIPVILILLRGGGLSWVAPQINYISYKKKEIVMILWSVVAIDALVT